VFGVPEVFGVPDDGAERPIEGVVQGEGSLVAETSGVDGVGLVSPCGELTSSRVMVVAV
jgi:hypothetical protein